MREREGKWGGGDARARVRYSRCKKLRKSLIVGSRTLAHLLFILHNYLPCGDEKPLLLAGRSSVSYILLLLLLLFWSDLLLLLLLLLFVVVLLLL